MLIYLFRNEPLELISQNKQRAIKEQRLANLKLARKALVDKEQRRLAGVAKAKQTRAETKAAAQLATANLQAFYKALIPDIQKFIKY